MAERGALVGRASSSWLKPRRTPHPPTRSHVVLANRADEGLLPIAHHGLIGDGTTTALVGRVLVAHAGHRRADAHGWRRLD